MNKPKGGPARQQFVQTSIKVPRDMHEQLRKQARAEDKTVSAVIRSAVRLSLAASAAPLPESED
jgi:Arc/MetJ-type ribon-helix-helix transcriptional regulator